MPRKESSTDSDRLSRPRVWRRRAVLIAVFGLPCAFYAYSWLTYPNDKTPRGAYLRVVRAVNQTDPSAFFAYTEEAAQHACYTIFDYRKKSRELVERDFPLEERKAWMNTYESFIRAQDGPDVFALFAFEYGWIDQLRRDMSGVANVEVSGPRATVQTIQGTRYAFRRRPGGIWGLTAFTPVLVDEAEKAARDFKLLEKAASDYRRVGAASENDPSN